MIYGLLRALSRIALRWYYRDIQILDAERIPDSGPAILAANHNNALVDALVIGSALRRKVRLTAKATLLDHPLTRWVVAAVGIVPLRRVSDERTKLAETSSHSPDESRNADAFSLIIDALADGELVLIFPEGKSHSEPALAPLKTGCARIALQARDDRGVTGLRVIPIGLTFERKSEPRSCVLAQVGEGIAIDDIQGSDPTAVQALTARIDAALRDVTLNFASPQVAQRLNAMSSLLAGAFNDVRPLHAPHAPLADSISIARRLEEIRQHLPAATPEQVADVDAFVSRVDRFQRRMESLEIPVNDVTMSRSLTAGAWFAIRELLIGVVVLPLAMWGRVNHWLPITLARRLAAMRSKDDDDPAMHTLVSGLVFVLAFYTLIALAVGVTTGCWWAAAYLVSLPPTASLDFWYSDRLKAARQRARAYRTLRHDPLLHDELLDDVASLRRDAQRLNASVASPR
ncbi:MAG: lysophospholipid acyltransferase family protein [Gemmatimonadaceae bacterium]